MTSKKNDQIDENLRRVYQEMLEAELPDRFRDLLSQLKDKEGGHTSDSGTTEDKT